MNRTQKVFMDVIRETCQYQRKRDAELVAESLERMKVKGTKITQPDKAKFAALATPIQEEVAKNLKVEDLLALVRSHRGEGPFAASPPATRRRVFRSPGRRMAL
jgi:TRAP-type C4-dicarboxylate transport system substrate-binding protein